MTDHMNAAIEAGMNALLETSEQEAGWLGDLVHLEPDPDGDLCIVQLNDGTSIDVQKAVAEVMGAMLPHLRAMIAQEIVNHKYRNTDGIWQDFTFQIGIDHAAQIALGAPRD